MQAFFFLTRLIDSIDATYRMLHDLKYNRHLA